MAQPPLFDRIALDRARHRVRPMLEPVLQAWAADDLISRLESVNRRFKAPAVITPWADFWQQHWPHARPTPDQAVLDLQEGAHDVVMHALCLHWADDPLGQLIQCRRALQPDGLFLANLFGGETLATLRHVLLTAEARLTGGAHPRVAPMAGMADMTALMGRASFALPVVDRDVLTLAYPNILALCHDLRAMGEVNVLTGRSRRFTSRALFAEAEALWPDRDAQGRLLARFEFITLTGWSPSADQPKPLRPGSATTRLAEALGTKEGKLP